MKSGASIMANMVKGAMEQDDPLVPLIKEYYVARLRPENASRRVPEFTISTISRGRPPGRLSPSSVCGCERQAALKFLGAEAHGATIDPDSEGIFDDGNWRHHRWQYNFQDMAALFPDRFRYFAYEEACRIDRVHVAGHLDARIEILWKGQWIEAVVDFKGINAFGHDYVFRNYKAKEEHVKQLRAYMKAMGVKTGFLLYESKDRNTLVCFVVKITKDDWNEIFRWCRRVIKMMDRRQLPARHPDCNNGHYLYGICPYKRWCFGKFAENPVRVERKAYRGFPGVEELWQENLLEVEEGD